MISKRLLTKIQLVGIVVFGLLVGLSAPVLAVNLQIQVGAFSQEENLRARVKLVEQLGVEVELVPRDASTTAVRTVVLSDTAVPQVRKIFEQAGLKYFVVGSERSRNLEGNNSRRPLVWQELLERIATVEGVGYRWGGENPTSGFDCSGLLNWLLMDSRIPRTVSQMIEWTRPVDQKELEPGDFIYFQFRLNRPDHVGLYLGDGEFVHASSTHGVIIVELGRSYYQQRLVGYGRAPVQLVELED